MKYVSFVLWVCRWNVDNIVLCSAGIRALRVVNMPFVNQPMHLLCQDKRKSPALRRVCYVSDLITLLLLLIIYHKWVVSCCVISVTDWLYWGLALFNANNQLMSYIIERYFGHTVVQLDCFFSCKWPKISNYMLYFVVVFLYYWLKCCWNVQYDVQHNTI